MEYQDWPLIVRSATIKFGQMMRDHGMTIEKSILKIGAASVLALALAGCDGSSRFSDFGGSRQAVAPPPPRAQTFTPAPTGRVDSTPLPPPGGANPALGGLPPAGPGGITATPGIPPIGSTVPIDPEPPRAPTRQAAPVLPEPAPTPPPQVAARSPEPAPPSSGAPTRSSVTGSWTAREASGSNCRMTLSSTPTLDLYKASSSGCQSRELQRVSAWELRGDEVYLYEPGGGVAARLKQSGRNFEGSAAKTGAPVSLQK
jgi:Protease inhibitor Inh